MCALCNSQGVTRKTEEKQHENNGNFSLSKESESIQQNGCADLTFRPSALITPNRDRACTTVDSLPIAIVELNSTYSNGDVHHGYNHHECDCDHKL